ncbi:MAG: hypothetical protein V3V47_07165 [Desulfobacteria bacterium]
MAIHNVKVVLEQPLAKRINLPQATGMYENSSGTGTILFQCVEQLVSRSAVEITCQFQVNVAIVSVKEDSEIRCHDCSSSGRAKLGEALACFNIPFSSRFPIQDMGDLLFEITQVHTLYRIAFGAGQAGVIHVAVVSSNDKDRQVWILPLDVAQNVPSIESVQIQIEKHQIWT